MPGAHQIKKKNSQEVAVIAAAKLSLFTVDLLPSSRTAYLHGLLIDIARSIVLNYTVSGV